MIILEACTNWNTLEDARKMIEQGKEGGASFVKFQLYDSHEDFGTPHYQWAKDHELTFEQARELFLYGAEIGMEVFFTPFGAKYVYWCELIGVKRYKIACRYRDIQAINAMRVTNKPIIRSVFNVNDAWPGDINLYCVPVYPTEHCEITFPSFHGFCDGFSDHTRGIDASKIALARGAQIIEKHYCLSHSDAGPDVAWSMDLSELKELVRFDNLCQEIK
jgi:sialic acid synthase SpsE